MGSDQAILERRGIGGMGRQPGPQSRPDVREEAMSGALLLDTCTCIWIMNNEWLRPDAVDAIDEAHDRGDKIYVSPITAWEIGNLARKRRFKSSHSPQRWLE